MVQLSTSRLNSFLPQVALATGLVVVVPTVIGWVLRATGVVPSELTAIAIVVCISLLMSYAGGAFWRSRSGSGDLLFSELMVWGWLRRWWKERRLALVLRLLDGVDTAGAAEDLDRERRTQVLIELANVLEARDPYTHGHSHRVARHAEMLAEAMGLASPEIAKIRTAALLHDVGKIHTPVAILHKPGRLSSAEFELIKRHPGDGATMVATLGDPKLTAMVRDHHERLDGSGYPAGLAGQDISVGARIIAVADTFDAIISTRPYRGAKTHKQALQILKDEAGTTLDADAVGAFSSYYWGRRPLVLWLGLTNVFGRLASNLGGGANAAASSLTRVVAASAVTSASAVAISFPLLPPVGQADASDSVPATPTAFQFQNNPLASVGSPVGGLPGTVAAANATRGPAAPGQALVFPSAQTASAG